MQCADDETRISNQKWIIADRRKVCLKLKAVNIELYLASVNPRDSRETLKCLIHAQLWMFLWDDEMDSMAGQFGGEDLEAAQRFREVTLRYIKHGLGLTGEIETGDLADDVLITSFSAVSDPLQGAHELLRRDVYNALELAIGATATEQRRRMSSYLPERNEYLANRYYSIGIPICRAIHCALIGSTVNISPRPEIKEMRYTSSLMTAIANDIMSLRKELRTGATDSLVPILWVELQSQPEAERRDLQSAVDKACEIMESLRKSFDRAERILLATWPKESLGELKTYIEVSKTQVTGNYTWTKAAKRYGLAECKVNGEYIVRMD